MDTTLLLAFAQGQRFLGLDWSYITILGAVGTAVFSVRFLVQWIASERKGESVIPISFWYFSIVGSTLLCIYFVFRHDPIGILGNMFNSFVYLRNLHLISKRKATTASTGPQPPAAGD